MQINGLWINRDPNLLTYNDGEHAAQVLRKVKSLLCSSYSFLVQVFVPAYVHFREHPNEFYGLLERLNRNSTQSNFIEYLFTELWDYIDHAKQIVSERVREECPFDRFQSVCEAEWYDYVKMFGGTPDKDTELWNLIQPTLRIMRRRFLELPTEVRYKHKSLGTISAFVPHRQRILFLSGQGVNSQLAKTLLDQTGWLKYSPFDFVVPDAPYKMPAFTNDEQLEKLGLDGLGESGTYDKTTQYREWKVGFEDLFDQYHHGKPVEVTKKTYAVGGNFRIYQRNC